MNINKEKAIFIGIAGTANAKCSTMVEILMNDLYTMVEVLMNHTPKSKKTSPKTKMMMKKATVPLPQ